MQSLVNYVQVKLQLKKKLSALRQTFVHLIIVRWLECVKFWLYLTNTSFLLHLQIMRYL